MTFDEQVQRAFGTLADRLREHIAGELRGAAADLAAAARADREAAVAMARAEAREAAQADREAAIAAATAEARQAAQESARQSLDAAVASERAGLKTADLATSERLLEAIRAIDRARSLSEILDILVSCAGREASRAGILLVRAGQLRGWRFIGFGPAFDAANEIELPVQSSGLIAEAVRTGAAVSSDTSGRTAAPAFAELPDGREALAVPIPMGGQVVGVLYADQGHTDDQSRASAITWPDALEVMARHSARCLEALTAFRAARVLTERPDVPPGTGSDQPDLTGSCSGGRADEDPEDGSESARRYARLLVSEIKLYHEAAVIAGRRERDLATRLAAEIARARALYEQRVAAPVRQDADYFQAELVRTLANGDANLLGQTT
jgi:hypothetical protein